MHIELIFLKLCPHIFNSLLYTILVLPVEQSLLVLYGFCEFLLIKVFC